MNTHCTDGFLCCTDPDEPCLHHGNGACECHVFAPKCQIRYSSRFVEQVRDLSGDQRWPLRVAGDER